MTAPSSGTPLPQRPAAANGTEFPTQRALGRRAFRSARRCPGAERGPQLRAQPPGTTAAAADAVPRAVLPNFRRLHEARSARGPARTSGRLPPGASFPAVKRTPRTPQRTEGNSARGPARPYLQTPFRPRRAAPDPARRREPRAPPGRRRGGRSRGAAQRRPPPRRPRSAATVRRAAPGERRGAERSGPGRGRRGGREQSAFVRRAGPRGRLRAPRPAPPSPEPPPHSRASPGSSGAALLTRPGPAAPPPAPARRPPASPQSPPPQPPPCNPARRAGGGGDGGGSASAGRCQACGVPERGGPGPRSRSRRSSPRPGRQLGVPQGRSRALRLCSRQRLADVVGVLLIPLTL